MSVENLTEVTPAEEFPSEEAPAEEFPADEPSIEEIPVDKNMGDQENE